MTRLAYFDLASGVSGDMTIAALADAGRRLGVEVQQQIADAVASLGLGCSVTFVDDERGGIACLRAEVKAGDQTYTPSELNTALEQADVADTPRRRALRGLDALVAAEAVVHGTSIDDVHLHELGSADTAADLIGAAAGLHALDVTTVAAASVPVPTGHIETEHGRLPLPAPVTLELLTGALLRGVEATTELVTPTGAAILIAHGARFGPLPEMTLEATGVGGGTRDTETPNICRLLVGMPSSSVANVDTVVLFETNIDDQTPESLGHAVETLIRAGALDAWVTPIVMKKTRPAFLLSVLVRPADEAHIVDGLFRHTTTLGVRRRETTRWSLDRSELYVRIEGHDVRVKVATLGNDTVNVAPEFGDCVDVATRTGRSVDEVYEHAKALASSLLANTATE
jgi:uncharacterized protein (TIGR00299 family) protein